MEVLRDRPTGEKAREHKRHGDARFPMTGYLTKFDEIERGCVQWHWHPEIEILMATQGRVTLSTDRERRTLQSGEGALINSSVLHTLRAESEGAETRAFVAHPLLLAHSAGDVMFEECVLPILNCRALPVVFFSPDTPWQAECLREIEKMCALEREKRYGYRFAQRNALCELWDQLVQNASDRFLTRQTDLSRDDQRIKKMLGFIYAHYGRPVSLEEIAAAAGIGKTECYRCFQRALGMKPIEFLTEHRLSEAMRLLRETDLPAGEIALKCGFNSPSYFSKQFRARVGCAPGEYRGVQKVK